MPESTSSAITEDYIDDNWSVSIAPTTPLIAFDDLIEEYTKEGFLIGELKGLQEVPISDEVERPYTRCKTLEIKTFLKSLNYQPFYDRYGRVIPEVVKKLLGNLLPVTVGWYRCRSFRGTKITQKENMIHRDLMSLVPLPKYFVFCIINKPTEYYSSFNFGGMFFQYNDSLFEPVPSKLEGAGPSDLPENEVLSVESGVHEVYSQPPVLLRDQNGRTNSLDFYNNLIPLNLSLKDKKTESTEVDNKWSVSMAPITVPLLAVDNLAYYHVQQGLLIGEMKERSEVVPISDAVENPYIRRYKTLHIKTCVKWNTGFYNNGRLREMLTRVLGDLFPKMVGWYRCTTSSGAGITAREAVIHQNLMSLVPLLPEYFVFCIVNFAQPKNTFIFKRTFVTYKDFRFEVVPEEIMKPFSPRLVGDEFLRMYPGIPSAEQRDFTELKRLSEYRKNMIRRLLENAGARLTQIAEELPNLENQTNELERRLLAQIMLFW
ncbi:uncharacterized protein LOC135128828 [Zophobas morio]|uniref:uncharacterized protein LOC135128828 n=1 Tax=Zophobas morio TaxID=2755281 RepID=UPI0030839ADE